MNRRGFLVTCRHCESWIEVEDFEWRDRRDAYGRRVDSVKRPVYKGQVEHPSTDFGRLVK